MKFNVVIALPNNPADRVHARCFIEVLHLLRHGLEDLGEKVIFGGGYQEDCINLVLGYQFLNGVKLPPGKKYIFYQLEELSEDEGWPLNIIETLRTPDAVVWDFSEKNVDFLAQRGIKAILKPLGFHPEMLRIRPNPTRDVDVLFYGSQNKRRVKILQELHSRFKTQILFGAYGEQRDEWISRAKIVVSIYYYETKLFDDIRISYLANNKVFSIIENSPNRKYEDFLVYADYDQIVERCGFYLESDELRNQKIEAAFQAFSHYPESEFLRTALAQSL